MKYKTIIYAQKNYALLDIVKVKWNTEKSL